MISRGIIVALFSVTFNPFLHDLKEKIIFNLKNQSLRLYIL